MTDRIVNPLREARHQANVALELLVRAAMGAGAESSCG
jgi:hypothetical protein